MPLADLVYMPGSLDTGCTALPAPASLKLLELFQSTLQHQEETVMRSFVPTLSFKNFEPSSNFEPYL